MTGHINTTNCTTKDCVIHNKPKPSFTTNLMAKFIEKELKVKVIEVQSIAFIGKRYIDLYNSPTVAVRIKYNSRDSHNISLGVHQFSLDSFMKFVQRGK